ncbi:MAG: STAS domain-containing protein [Acidobacteria bacterium]|nr:STAS domain-containing protein [Acidobacteriota bacterium]
MQLEIRERKIGQIVILDLTGKITIGDGSNKLRDEVNRLLEIGEREIILNFEGTSYLDSSGIGELISRHTTTKNQGGHLKLLKLPKKIRDLLTVTKLLGVFETFENEQDAVLSFGVLGVVPQQNG